MKAITIPQPGDADSLTLADVDAPAPGRGEVLIDVAAAGVNRADIQQRKGFYDPPPGTSPYPGLEVSGTVSRLGEGVDPAAAGVDVGDEVCALLVGGGYAEQVSVPVGQVLPVPAGVSLVEAAGLPEVACTVWSNVFMVADLQPGQVFLCHGGSSGIGTMAIQLAREFGARVAVTAGSRAKLDVCRDLGADILVDYKEEDFVARVKDETDGYGADVVLDGVGAKYLPGNVDVLATGGRIVTIGLLGGRKGELDLGKLLGKRGSVAATSLRARPATEKARIVTAVREHVWPLVAAGKVTPIVQETLPLAEAGRAHTILEESHHIGKVLLVP